MRWRWEAANPVSPATLASRRSAQVGGEPAPWGPGMPPWDSGTAQHVLQEALRQLVSPLPVTLA